MRRTNGIDTEYNRPSGTGDGGHARHFRPLARLLWDLTAVYMWRFERADLDEAWLTVVIEDLQCWLDARAKDVQCRLANTRTESTVSESGATSESEKQP